MNKNSDKRSEMSRKKQGRKEAASSSSMDLSSPDTDIRSIMRDIESFGKKFSFVLAVYC